MLLIGGLISHTAMLKQLLHKPWEFQGHLSKYLKKTITSSPVYKSLKDTKSGSTYQLMKNFCLQRGNSFIIFNNK